MSGSNIPSTPRISTTTVPVFQAASSPLPLLIMSLTLRVQTSSTSVKNGLNTPRFSDYILELTSQLFTTSSLLPLVPSMVSRPVITRSLKHTCTILTNKSVQIVALSCWNVNNPLLHRLPPSSRLLALITLTLLRQLTMLSMR